MSIIVTGAHGFVGLNVTRHLAAQGTPVIAVGRQEPDEWVRAFLEGVEELVTFRRADLALPGSLAEAVAGESADAVIHAAVVTATTEQVERDDALNIVRVNVGGTMEALDLARQHNARRFVYVSSPSAIGDVDPDTMMDEQVEKRPSTLYGISKDASEEFTRRYGEIHDLSTVSVRIAQPYGPGERATASRIRTSPIYEWLRDAEQDRPLPTGPLERTRDWTYVDDTARGIVALAEAEELDHDLYHLGLGQQVSVSDVITQIRTAYPGITWEEIPTADALNPNIASDTARPPLDSSRFHDEFGWSPEIGIRDGMRRYLDWWRRFPHR